MPDRFMPVSKEASLPDALTQINRSFQKLDREATLKQFKDNDGNTMLTGNIGNGVFGTQLLDADGTGIFIGLYQSGRFGMLEYYQGTPIYLNGMHPVDGHTGEWRSKNNQDVIALLGG